MLATRERFPHRQGCAFACPVPFGVGDASFVDDQNPGAGRFKLRAIDGPDRVTFQSTDARTVIGAAESADLRLTDPTVSRFHREIVAGEREVRIRESGLGAKSSDRSSRAM